MPDPRDIAARINSWPKKGPQGPLTLELYPTLRCNLACSFCDTTDRHRPPVNELTLERHLELLNEASELGVERVFVLGGGEPLAAKDKIQPILARIKELKMEGILTTNGVLMNRQIRSQLIETGWDEVHVSIDAPTAEIHDSLRGQDGAFNRTIKNICRLRGERKQAGATHPKVALHFVLTNKNWRTLPDMVRLGASLGAFRIDFDSLIAYTPDQLTLQLSEEEREKVPQIAKEAMEVAAQVGLQTTLANFLDDSNLRRGDRDVTIDTAPATTSSSAFALAPCLKAWHYIVVQADGKISPCCVLAGEGESLRDRPLKDLWVGSEYLNNIRSSMIKGKPTDRCIECSANILAHEADIRHHL